jgi:hypothetical protein
MKNKSLLIGLLACLILSQDMQGMSGFERNALLNSNISYHTSSPSVGWMVYSGPKGNHKSNTNYSGKQHADWRSIVII